MSIIKRNETNWLPSIFDDFRTDWLGGTNESSIGTNIPAVNIQETDEKFEVEVAAPGMTKKDFNLEVENNVLTISSEQKDEKEVTKDGGNYTRREFSYRNFRRAFSLPDSVDSEKIAANYKNGVLHVTLPKREDARKKGRRQIEIS